MLLGGLLIHGLLPGPRLFEQNGDVILGLYAGSLVATLAQIAVGILILPLCMWMVNRPRPYLSGFIFALVLSGIYTINSSMFDIGLMLVGGLVGYLMKLTGFPFLPAVLGVVLGPMIEGNYRRSLLLSDGDHMVFWEDLIGRGLIAAALVFIVISLARELRAARTKAA